ncbi:MAG: preprotein translocase subunit SecG [Acidobacteriales bacterium]|nr:preprotein translocase subunit SecG [Terriglobales bacterium]
MIIFLTILHIVVCLFLIIVVLLQHGKSADLAGTFGGVGSQTAFGPRGAATTLSRATAVAVVLFMATSLGLSLYNTRGASTPAGGSVLDKTEQSKPAAPPAPAPQQGQPAQTPPAPQNK